MDYKAIHSAANKMTAKSLAWAVKQDPHLKGFSKAYFTADTKLLALILGGKRRIASFCMVPLKFKQDERYVLF